MWQIQWVLSLIPDSILIWIYYLLLLAGLGLYVCSKLVKLIPLMGQYKLPAELVGVAVLCLASWLLGGYGVEMAWRDKVKELEAKVAIAEQKSQQVNTVIQTKVVERVKMVEKKVEVVRTQIEKDKEIINAECKVPDIAVIDYNKAVADPTEDTK
jgi:hypothetical protein